jgi:outer membrane protein OmpA-like peptidoglycan-associated protein
MKLFITGLLVISSIFSCFGQQKYTTENKKAIKYYEEAITAFDQFKYVEGSDLMNKAIKADKRFMEAFLVLAEMKTEQGLKKEAIAYYYEAIKIKPDFFPSMYYNLSKLEMAVNEFDAAKSNLEKFLSFKNISEVKKKDAGKLLKSCEFAINAVKNPVPFNPVNLGDSINSRFSEYWPSLTADGSKLVLTRMLPLKNASGQYITDANTPEEFVKLNPEGIRKVFEIFQEDFFVSVKKNEFWSFAQELGNPINSKQSEGAQSLTSDGSTMFFTACNRKDGLGHCDIYSSSLEIVNWTEPVNIGSPVNSAGWDAQPSISPDGKTLFFISDRENGFGGKDIWRSTLFPDGKWSIPQNLGEKINTSGDEQSPFIHFDNKTLYFSSNGHLGMGGSDIFRSTLLPDGTWSEPLNLGFPINTSADEIGFIVTANGEKAFFSSDRFEDKGRDIFEFELYKEARPNPVSYIKGKVFDAENMRKLNAHFELIDLNSEELIMQAESDKSTGEFLLCIPADNDYVLNVSKDGYLFYSDNFSLKGIHEITNPFLKDVALNPIKKGQKIILRNIFFFTDSYELEEKSVVELNKLVDFLIQNPTLKVEISGHTDNIGTLEYNLSLSENRAKSVVNFLINKNISNTRLRFKGYGESNPIDTNETDIGRANNRRTEITVLEI